jgi:hypothetical protein
MIAGHGAADFYVDEEAVAQAIKTRLLLLWGEWWEDTSDGLPLYQNIIGVRGTQANLAATELLIRDRIAQTENVLEVVSLSSDFDQETRTVYYNATVNTPFGLVELNDVIDDPQYGYGNYLAHTHTIPPISGRITINGRTYEMDPIDPDDTGYVTLETYMADNYLLHTHSIPAVIGKLTINGTTYPLETDASEILETLPVDINASSLQSYATHTHGMPPVRGHITINGHRYEMEPTDAGHTSVVNNI